MSKQLHVVVIIQASIPIFINHIRQLMQFVVIEVYVINCFHSSQQFILGNKAITIRVIVLEIIQILLFYFVYFFLILNN